MSEDAVTGVLLLTALTAGVVVTLAATTKDAPRDLALRTVEIVATYLFLLGFAVLPGLGIVYFAVVLAVAVLTEPGAPILDSVPSAVWLAVVVAVLLVAAFGVGRRLLSRRTALRRVR